MTLTDFPWMNHNREQPAPITVVSKILILTQTRNQLLKSTCTCQ